MSFSIIIIPASIISGFLINYFLFLNAFSSIEVFIISTLNTEFAALFFSFLYIFAGPVTADRSFASQLLMNLQMEKEKDLDGLLKNFNSRDFINKRLEECLGAGLIRNQNGKFGLTKKGKVVAKSYYVLFHLYGLRKREGFCPYL